MAGDSHVCTGREELERSTSREESEMTLRAAAKSFLFQIKLIIVAENRSDDVIHTMPSKGLATTFQCSSSSGQVTISWKLSEKAGEVKSNNFSLSGEGVKP